MKLTLRYLLAYLDDVLKPKDAAQVGRLIKENERASELVDRIHRVVRQRRLAAPRPADKRPGLNANDVAEYLDNLTPPDILPAYEESLLKSDEKLAEVAATHQILSLVLGGPPQVPSSTRSQLEQIALTFLPEDASFHEEAEPGSAVDIPAMEAPTIQQTNPEVVIPFEMPKRSGSGKQFLVILGVLLLLGGWAYSILTDPSFTDFQGNSAEKQQREPADQQVALADNTEQASDEVPESDETGMSEDATGSKGEKPAKAGERQAASSRGEESPRADQSDKRKATSPVEPETKPAMEQDGSRPAEIVDEEDNGEQEKPDEPERSTKAPQFVFVSDGQLLIHVPDRPSGQTATVAQPDSVIEANDALFSPMYSVASFLIDEGAARFQMRNNSAAVLVGTEKEDCLALELTQGDFILDSRPEAGEDSLKTVDLIIGPHLWTIELPEERTLMAIRVEPRTVRGFETNPPGGTVVAQVWATENPVSLQSDGGEFSEPDSYFRLLPKPESQTEKNTSDENEEGQDKDLVPEIEPEELAQNPAPPAPAWIDGRELELTRSQRRDYQDFLKLVEESKNLWIDLQGVANHPNPRIAEIATQVLSLGRRYRSLVSILARSPHEESRTQAIRGLQIWLAQEPIHRDLLLEELEKTFSPETAQTVYRLLWGFKQEDATRPDISRQLIEGLKHEHVAVRELSIYWIYKLTGQKLGYRPLATATTREQAVNAWERHLSRYGALVEPEED